MSCSWVLPLRGNFECWMMAVSGMLPRTGYPSELTIRKLQMWTRNNNVNIYLCIGVSYVPVSNALKLVKPPRPAQ